MSVQVHPAASAHVQQAREQLLENWLLYFKQCPAVFCFYLVLPKKTGHAPQCSTVLPTKAGKTILVPATNSGRRKLARPPVLHILLMRTDPQSAAEALALMTALADFTNTRNTKDMSIETLSVRLRDPPHTASSSARSGFFGQRWRT